MKILKDSIVAFDFNDDRGLVCAECLTDEEWDELNQDGIMTEEEFQGINLNEPELVFCDRCREQIPNTVRPKEEKEGFVKQE